MTTEPAQSSDPRPMLERWRVRCTDTKVDYPPREIRYRSENGALLEVIHELDALQALSLRETWTRRLGAFTGADGSGVWRYRELILPVDSHAPVTMREGSTPLYEANRIGNWANVSNLLLKHEGHNPTGSFKDRGMTAGVTAAKLLGQRAVACASTGNTSASMAAYAAHAGMHAVVFIPAGGIALGKLSQALAYGATVVQIRGNFDDAMRLVQEVCRDQGVYLLNSINPYRIEGQKAIGIEMMHQLGWNVPDWIVVPGGNLGNSSAIYKGLAELCYLGMIDRLPRIAVAQATGAAPLYAAFKDDALADEPRSVTNPKTLASAIRIGSPVSWGKCVRAIQATKGVVTAVSDEEILAAKREVDGAGIGAEPASCASVAGLKKLVGEGVISKQARVVCVLTGHVLKDADAVIAQHAPGGDLSKLPVCEPTLTSVSEVVSRTLGLDPSKEGLNS
ncbi:MAG: threonine synthase [Planctomycetota bacterium]